VKVQIKINTPGLDSRIPRAFSDGLTINRNRDKNRLHGLRRLPPALFLDLVQRCKTVCAIFDITPLRSTTTISSSCRLTRNVPPPFSSQLGRFRAFSIPSFTSDVRSLHSIPSFSRRIRRHRRTLLRPRHSRARRREPHGHLIIFLCPRTSPTSSRGLSPAIPYSSSFLFLFSSNSLLLLEYLCHSVSSCV
jgi:hypothetical protein